MSASANSTDGSLDPASLLKENRDEILEIARRRGVEKIRVFGSVARGEATAESDVDLLVDLEPDRSLLDLGGLLSDIENLLGCEVHVVTEPSLHWYIRESVIKEAVPL